MQNIDLINLTYSFASNKESNVLDNINLKLDAGDFVVILGESGCGKTTLLNLIAGLIDPPPGTIFIDEKEIQGPDSSRSVIFQTPRLLPWLDVRDNIAFGCKIRKETEGLNEKLDKYIELIGLKEFETSKPNILSSGMAQRVALARSLIGNPDILLLDEPFAALDYYNRSRLQKELVKLWKEFKFTAVLVTHDIEEALILGKKIVLLSNRPARILNIYNIYEDNPRNIETKELYDLKCDIQSRFRTLLNINDKEVKQKAEK